MSKAATTIGTAVLSNIATAMNAVADKLNARNNDEDITGAQLMGFLEEAMGSKPATSPAAPKETKAKESTTTAAAAASTTCTFKAPRAKKDCGKPAVDGTDRCEDCAKTSAEKPKPPTAASKKAAGKTLPFTSVGKGTEPEADGDASAKSEGEADGEAKEPEPAKEVPKAPTKKAAATKTAPPKPKEPETPKDTEEDAEDKPKAPVAKPNAKAAAKDAKAGDSKEKVPEVASSKSLIDRMKAKQVAESGKTQDVDDLAAGATQKSGTATAAKPAAPKGAAPKAGGAAKAPAPAAATSKAAPKAPAAKPAPKGGKAPAKKPVDEDEPSGDEGSDADA